MWLVACGRGACFWGAQPCAVAGACWCGSAKLRTSMAKGVAKEAQHLLQTHQRILNCGRILLAPVAVSALGMGAAAWTRVKLGGRPWWCVTDGLRSYCRCHSITGTQTLIASSAVVQLWLWVVAFKPEECVRFLTRWLVSCVRCRDGCAGRRLSPKSACDKQQNQKMHTHNHS